MAERDEYLKTGKRNSATDAERLQKIHDLATENGAQCKSEMDYPQRSLPDNALKAISQTDDELVVGNHIIVFGGRDLTGIAYAKNKDGSSGEYFTAETDLESEYTKAGRVPVDFEHGRDPDGIGIKDDVLGYVDWSTAKSTDQGVFVQRVLYRRNKYVKWLEPLIKEGLIGNSTESIAGKSIRLDDGKIVKWPVKRDTLTVTPMEPRMLTQNSLAAIKALSEYIPELKSLIIPDKAALPNVEETKSITGEATMTETTVDVKALVDAALAERDNAAKAVADRKAEIKAAEDAAYLKGIEDAKKKGQFKGVPAVIPEGHKGDDNDGVMAFKSWIMTGQENEGLIRPESVWKSNDAKAAFNITTSGTGGALVPDPLYGVIQAKRNIASWVRQAPCQHFSTPADHLLIPVESTSHTAFVLTAESAAYDENEGTVAQVDAILLKYTKEVVVTEEFAAYNATNFDAWLANALARAEAVTENTVATTALLASATAGTAAAAQTALTIPEVERLYGTLGAGYNIQGETGILMKNATKYYLRGVAYASYQTWAQIGPDGRTVLGDQTAYISDDMPAMTTSLRSTCFGNFNYFGVVERPGMMVQRNPYLLMANGQIALFASIYRSFKVLQAEAFYTMAQA